MASLYSTYKVVGCVTDGNPFVLNRLGEENFLITSIGKAFQVFKTDKLNVCLASASVPAIPIQHDDDGMEKNSRSPAAATQQGTYRIKCIQAHGHETFAAVGNVVTVFNRTRHVRNYSLGSSTVNGMCMVGRVLLVYDLSNTIHLIDTKARLVVSSTALLVQSPITCVIHPATYINKFLVAYSNGQLDLWNSSSNSIIHTFQCISAFFNTSTSTSTSTSAGTDAGAGSIPAITTIEQSPALDVVAVGFDSGHILLINLKLDRVLFSFRQESSAVTSFAFRTDVAASKFPFLASAGSDGRIYVWNLGTRTAGSEDVDSGNYSRDDDDDDEDLTFDFDYGDTGTGGGSGSGSGRKKGVKLERKLHFSLDEAHLGCISKLHFLHGEPILISSSVDNSIKMWIFDSPDGSARLLRSRSGHYGYPLKIRYYGGVTNASMNDNPDAFSCEILSCGSEAALRVFNTAVEGQNMELSQRPILKKLRLAQRNARLPVVIDFDACEAREKNWGNLVTIHKNSCGAVVWKYRHRVSTESMLKQPQWKTNGMKFTPDANTFSSSVCVTSCGNFCVVGTRGGTIYLYNLQSSATRGAYPLERSAASLRDKEVQVREATPGNVLYVQKKIRAEGIGAHANSLNPKPKPTVDQTAAASASEISSASGHNKEVTGVFVDMCNALMMSCSLDGSVIFWDFESHHQISRVDVGVPLLRLQGFRDAGFVAVVGRDRSIRVFDITSQKIIRRYNGGHAREVSDLAFTPDGRKLLSSSLDCTVRVWDLPTGRCLSWLRFDAPVLSITVSHSGEYLCLTQLDKEGIFMYIDRSLYETIHIWQEPLTPTVVQDCVVHADVSDSSAASSGAGAGGGGGGGGASRRGFLSESEDVTTADEEDDDDDNDDAAATAASGAKAKSKKSRGKGGIATTVTPSQAQISSDEQSADIDTTQRGVGVVTFSTVPRAYWTTLFHLELIKERNKAQAAPTAPAQAPFFLPTLVKSGSTPSFPTPLEYAKLQTSLQQSTSTTATATATVAGAEVSHRGSKRGLDVEEVSGAADGVTAASSSKKKTAARDRDGAIQVEKEEDVVAALASMSSAWSDDDGEENGGDDDAAAADGDDVGGDGWPSSSSSSSKITGTSVSMSAPPVFKSRILGKSAVVSRCKLMVYLDKLKGSHPEDDAFDCVTAFLRALTPSAVDVELRALCLHDGDESGLEYLSLLLRWLEYGLRSAASFELFQAYLHRTLTIYADTILTCKGLETRVKDLLITQNATCRNFSDLVQCNLCVLKVLTGLASHT